MTKKRPINTKNPIFSNILSFAFIPDVIWPTHDLSEPVGKSYAVWSGVNEISFFLCFNSFFSFEVFLLEWLKHYFFKKKKKEEITGITYCRERKTTIFARLRLKWYRCKSGIVIFPWNYALRFVHICFIWNTLVKWRFWELTNSCETDSSDNNLKRKSSIMK